MNWLFGIMAALAAVGAFLTRRRLVAEGLERQGPVPGYSSTDGKLLKIDPAPELVRDQDWWAVSIEEFHSQARTRVVVELGVRSGLALDQVKQLVLETCREVASLTHSHVVYAEAFEGHRLKAAVMLAPDGRGWTGQEPVPRAWLVPEELA